MSDRKANPFTLTFGQKPTEFIPMDQIQTVFDTFDSEAPSNRVYMITGIRGAGKTVSLTEIAEHYKTKKDWIVLRLSSESDIIAAAISEIDRAVSSLSLDIGLNISLGFANLSISDSSQAEKESELRSRLENLGRKGMKVLFLIDEIIKNPFIKSFASVFQIYISSGYPVFLIMAGLYGNISDLQNEKTLTFLYRAPKIFLEELSLPAMTGSYREVFDISPQEAVGMARLTKGYPFAFQILGYLKWEKLESIDKLMPKFDEMLASHAYEKIWSELSALDRRIMFAVASGCESTADIRNQLGISAQQLNLYRKRLMERGVIDGSIRGKLKLKLPRFAEYMEMFCEPE